MQLEGKTIQDLTGAAMGVQEAERIKATVPNLDDAPDVFARKLTNSIRLVREAIVRHKGALGAGTGQALPPSPNLGKIEAGPRKEFDSMPMPGEYAGKRIKTPEGIVYRSDGSKWMRE